MPRIGDKAPKFPTVTTQGKINFPSDLNPEDDVIVSPTSSCGVAEKRMTSDDELDCEDWFFCIKKLDKDKVLSEVLKI